MLSIILFAMASDPAPGRDLLQKMSDCRTIKIDAERLACYDRTVVAIDDAKTKKDFVVLERGEVQKAKRDLFGFSLPSIRLFGDGQADEPLKQLVGVLQTTTGLPGGLMRFTLQGAGMWETTEATMVGLRQGDTVTIKAGSLGSYVATAPGRRSVRVRRLR
ncbi:hypothetical protein [Sphingomonas sp. CV7422]|uniref:hypothetical protein n=1 Tax=Sphingomonas sp. CV7422 TaxID=3018036 RepID=UPI0022FE91A6|nr:hypothetical protein [Sphingomonas sp. CV7422]